MSIDRKNFYDGIRPLMPGGRLTQAQVDVLEPVLNNWEAIFYDCSRSAAQVLVGSSTNAPSVEGEGTRLSLEGSAILMQREGCRLTAYQDSVGIWTIGVGHTSAAGPPPVSPGMKISQGEADVIFANDSHEFQDYVRKGVKVPITQNQFDSLTSFVYNVGPTNFNSSTLLKCVNANDMDGAFHQFSQWRKPPEIIPGRRAEACQFQYNVVVQTIPNGSPLLQQYPGLDW